MNPLISAADILETEANQLAHLVDDKAFAALNYRVEIAVRSEMTRMRDIAYALRKRAAHDGELTIKPAE